MAVSRQIEKTAIDIKANIEDLSIKAHRDYQASIKGAKSDITPFVRSSDARVSEFATEIVESLNTRTIDERLLALRAQKEKMDLLIAEGVTGADKLAEVFYQQLYASMILQKVHNFNEVMSDVSEGHGLQHEEEAFTILSGWITELKESNEILFLLAYAPEGLQDILGSTVDYAKDYFDIEAIDEMLQSPEVPEEMRRDISKALTLERKQEQIAQKSSKKRSRENSTLSQAWVNQKAKELLEPSKPGVRSTAYLKFEDGMPQLTEPGLKEAKRILSECINNQDMDAPLTQEQLVVLSVFFGVDIMKSVYDRYGLKGDARETNPFDYDNLRAIIIGIGSNYTMDDLRKMPDEAAESLNGILEAALQDQQLKLPLRILRDFDKRKQNHIPIRSLPWYKQLGVYLGAIAEKIASVVARKGLEKYADTFVAGEGKSISSAIFSVTSSRNKANDNFVKDVQFLSSQAQARSFSNSSGQKSPETIENEILEKLKQSRTLDDFYTTYPVFDRSCSTEEKSKIEGFFSSEAPEEEQVEEIKHIIHTKVQDVLRAGRAEFMAHNLSYKDQYKRDGHILKLPGKDGGLCDFEVEGVIRDEKGLGVGFYTPVKGTEVEGDTIPLIINLPGTHDIDSAIRDLHPISAGLDEFSPDNPEKYRERIIKALNRKVAELKRLHPGKKIEIEIFGHSLGGGDSYNVDLMILEALAQNKFRKDMAEGVTEPLAEIDAAYASSANRNISENYSDALRTCLGQRKRKFGVVYSEDRSYSERDISNLTLDNISTVSRCSDRGAGMSKEVSDARQAATAYLCRDSDFKKEELNLHIKGDLLKHTAVSQGMADADPSDPLFRDKVHTSYVETDVGLGRYLWSFLEKDEISPIAAHTITQALSLEQSIKRDHRVLTNASKESHDKMKDVMDQSVKIPFTNKPVAELMVYRALKFTLYKSAKLINTIFNLVLKPFQAIRSGLSKLVRPEEYRSDLREEDMRLGEEVLAREHSRAQEIFHRPGVESKSFLPKRDGEAPSPTTAPETGRPDL